MGMGFPWPRGNGSIFWATKGNGNGNGNNVMGMGMAHMYKKSPVLRINKQRQMNNEHTRVVP